MKQSVFKKEWPLWIMLIVPFVYAVYVWNDLPDKIPIHWNSQGEIDDYGSKVFGALFAPGLNIALYFLLLLIPKIDPRKKNYDLFAGPYRIIRLSIILFLTVVYFITIRIALGDHINVGKVIPFGVCLLFAILGNYMTTIRPNWFVGIRTPWTLENETVWKKTHSLGGKLWFYAGILGMFVALISNEYFMYLFIPLMVIIIIIPIAYSYFLFRKLKLKKSDE